LVLVGVRVLFDETVCLQCLEQAVDCRPGETETLRELTDTQATRTARQSLQDRGRAVEGLDRGPPFCA